MEEERRLFYVGITRAKDRLYLLRALRRGGRGYAEDTLPSRYLDDIPPELLSGKTRTGRSFREARSAQTPAWLRPDPKPALSRADGPATVKDTQFRAGMRIKHSIWGEGIVLNARLQDGDETVDAVFESVGIKRMVASLAKIKIVERDTSNGKK